MFVKTRSMLMLLTSVSVLFGCNSGNGKTAGNVPDADQTGKPPEVKISSDPVKLSIAINVGWLGPDEFKKYFEDPVKKKYPNISFEVYDQAQKDTTLDALIAGGTIPDIVMQSNNLPYRYTGRGLEYDIQPLIKKFNFDLSKLDPTALNSVKVSSDSTVLTGLPWTMHFSALYYNKDIFDKFGVAYPKDGMTWDDYQALAVKLTRKEGDVQYRGMEPEQPKMSGYQLGLEAIDTKTLKATFNNDGWKRIFTLLKSFYDIPGNDKIQGGINPFIKDRNLAMYPTNNVLPTLVALPDFNWDIAQYPSFKDKPNIGMRSDAWILHITQTSRHKDEAFAAISTILSEEVQADMAKNARFPVLQFPTLNTVFGQNVPQLKGKHLEAVFKSQASEPKLITKFDGNAEDEMRKGIAAVVKGEKDINTALRDMEENLNKTIAADGTK